MSALTPADLRPVDLFDDLTDDELRLWADMARLLDVAPDAVVVELGDEPTGVFLLLEGEARALVREGGTVAPVGRHVAPTWIGAIPALTGTPLDVRIQATGAVRVALVPREGFRRLALAHPSVHQRIMARVAPVIGRLTAREQHRTRLAALGTMAAGLAHELNNPAAAAGRAAQQLAEAIETVVDTVARFVEAGLEREDAVRLVALQREAVASTGLADALAVADAADTVLDALEDRDVPRAWELAEPLAAAGLDVAWVERVAAAAGPATGDALAWVVATLTAQGLAEELQEATRRMSTLVSAVKSYAYMDRGEVVEVDVRESLDTTLTVLGHKLKHTAIVVVRDYEPELPRLMARGSELNQVWTNLLDNAIDALGETGTLTVRAHRDGDCLEVAVEDDGPGIAPDDQPRVFDDFFTTKAVGLGTGLGLAAARRIVVERHDGSLSFTSAPGRTVFTARLPLSGAT